MREETTVQCAEHTAKIIDFSTPFASRMKLSLVFLTMKTRWQYQATAIGQTNLTHADTMFLRAHCDRTI